MRETIEGIKHYACRLKLISALLALFLSGALIALTAAAWYYDRVIDGMQKSYGQRISGHLAHISRLEREVDHERVVTRGQLDEQARSIDSLLSEVAKMWGFLDKTAQTAGEAANTAKSASNAAKGAATAAARAAIRETVIVETDPATPEPKDPPAWLLNGG